MSLIETALLELGNFVRLLNPYKAGEFFETVEVKPRAYMMKYVAFMSIFTVVGYVLNLSFKQGAGAGTSVCPLNVAAEFALLVAVCVILMVFLSSMVLTIFGKNLTGVDLSTDEVATVVGYSSSVMLVSGILSFHAQAIILHWICVAYGIYLLYAAVSARYGLEKAFRVFMFFLAVVLISFMLIYVGASSLISIVSGLMTAGGVPESSLPVRSIPSYCIVGL